MERNRVLELALEALQRQRTGIAEEIEAIRAQLNGGGSAVQGRRSGAAPKGRMATAAQRRAHSRSMKAYWDRKKAPALKPAIAVKPAPAVSAKLQLKNEARKKAISASMKRAWVRRKSAAEKSARTKSKKIGK